MQIKPCNKSEPNADSEFILHSLKSLFIMYIINRLKRQFEMNIHRSMKQDPSTLQQQLPYLCKCYQDWSNRKTNYTALLREKISFAYSISIEIWKNEQYSEESDILVSQQPQRRYNFIQVESCASLQYYFIIGTDFISES